MELVSGEKLWRGGMTIGETISKEVSIRFTQQKIFSCTVHFNFALGHTSLYKLIRIYVSGAFEEDRRVRDMRAAIKSNLGSFNPGNAVLFFAGNNTGQFTMPHFYDKDYISL